MIIVIGCCIIAAIIFITACGFAITDLLNDTKQKRDTVWVLSFWDENSEPHITLFYEEDMSFEFYQDRLSEDHQGVSLEKMFIL